MKTKPITLILTLLFCFTGSVLAEKKNQDDAKFKVDVTGSNKSQNLKKINGNTSLENQLYQLLINKNSCVVVAKFGIYQSIAILNIRANGDFNNNFLFLDGVYFYLKHAKIINLKGSFNKTTGILKFNETYNKKISGYFEISTKEKGKNFKGISLKKKETVSQTDPTLINKGFSTMIQGSEFDKVRSDLDIAAGEFYVNVVRLTKRFQQTNPKKAIDKDGNPFLDQNDIKLLGPKGRGITDKNWKQFVQRIPNDIINLQLKKNKSLFKPISKIVTDNSDLFGNQLLQLILKTDLKELKKINFDFALVIGIGIITQRGPIIEKG